MSNGFQSYALIDMENYQIDLPEHWASYLINGDSSGMEQIDINQCDKDTKDLGTCIGVDEGVFFGQYRGFGCNLLTFIFRK